MYLMNSMEADFNNTQSYIFSFHSKPCILAAKSLFPSCCVDFNLLYIYVWYLYFLRMSKKICTPNKHQNFKCVMTSYTKLPKLIHNVSTRIEYENMCMKLKSGVGKYSHSPMPSIKVT